MSDDGDKKSFVTVTVNLPDKEVELNDIEIDGGEFDGTDLGYVSRSVRTLFPKATSAVFVVVF